VLALACTLLVPTSSGVAVAEAASGPCGWAAGPPPAQFDHVVWIIFENMPQSAIISSSNAPYINGLAAACGRADNMNGLYPKSLPNYVGLTSGTTGGLTLDGTPRALPQSQVSLFEQLGTDWRQLNESMPANCFMKNSGVFVVHHAPAQYYSRIRQDCRQLSVPLGPAPDISAKFTIIVPNKVHDMHKTATTKTIASRVMAGDQWTSGIMPQLLASPEYQAGRTAIVLTWDEANAKTTQIPFVVISPYTTPGTISKTAFSHYSLLKATEEMLGISNFLMGAGDPATESIRADFNLVAPARHDQTISFTSTPPVPAQVGGPHYTVTSTASSGLPVSFSANATSDGCSVAGSDVTFIAAGTCVIDADQGGDASYKPAPRVQQSFAVVAPSPADQTIQFGALPDKTFGDPAFAVSATATSGLRVTFSSLSVAVCDATGTDGATITLLAAGRCTIQADQAGDADFNPAPAVTQSFDVAPA
jgi:hypothetical protein